MAKKTDAMKKTVKVGCRENTKDGSMVSQLGFGCMRFPNGQDAVNRLIARAVELGINYFDTAYLYAGSEKKLGLALVECGARDAVSIATKLPQAQCRKREDFDRFFETSLERLQTDRVEYYLIHNLTSFAQLERLQLLGIFEWAAERKAEGSIGRFGFSFHGTYPEFLKILDAVPWDFCQIQYNYVNENYQAGRAGLHEAAKRGIPVIIMEPLLCGKLADKIPPAAAKVFKRAHAQSPAAWGLRWLWDQPEVTVVLSGMNSIEQLEETARIAADAAPGCLIKADRAVIEQAKGVFQESFRIPCTGCNYCMPCPQGISIPALFAAYNQSYSFGLFNGIVSYLTSAGATDEEFRFASSCLACGACEKKCPQSIRISEELVNVRKRLQPPGMVAGVKAYHRLSRKG